MKNIIFLILDLTLSCIQFPTKKPIEVLTNYERWVVMANGSLGDFLYDDSERLSLMPPPVVVVSKGAVSHGVFREKYKTYNVVVRSSENIFYTFYGTEWESVNVGDVIKKAPEPGRLW